MQLLKTVVIFYAILGIALSANIKQDKRPLYSNSSPFIAAVENSFRNYSRVDTMVHYLDDMEGDVSGWYYNGFWTLSTESYSSPTHSFNADDNGTNAVQDLISPVVSIPSIDDIGDSQVLYLSFDLWCDMPGWSEDTSSSLGDYYSVSIWDTSDAPPAHLTTTGAYSGNSWWFGLESTGGYLDGWLTFLDSPVFTVPSSNAELTFKTNYDIEDPAGASSPYDGWDVANVRISTDGFATWSVLNGAPAYDVYSGYGWGYNGEGSGIPGWAGNSGGWIDATFDLSSYAGQDAQIRFAFGSDPAVYESGWWIDNVVVEGDGGTVLEDNGDDNVVLVPSGEPWVDMVYDYGDISRPGGTGWVTYYDGMNYNGDLSIHPYAGKDVRFKFRSILGDSLTPEATGLWIDDLRIIGIGTTSSAPIPQNLTAVAGNQVVDLSWYPPSVSAPGEYQYDNDLGDGSIFTNGIYTSSGTFAAAELFQNLSGTIDIDTVMIFGYSSNTATATSIYGYNGNFAAGLIDDIPTYTMAVDLEVGFWNYFDVSDAGWSFDGDFAIGFEVGTTTGLIYAALDESAAPSVGSYTNLGGWDTWANVAANNGLPDGEWGIRAKAQTTGSDSLAVFYKMYRRIYGEQDWTQCWWMGGDEISGTTWQDYFVQNFTTYDYTVSAVINGNESEFSNTATATVEPITVHELAYDDDGMNTSINTGEGNLLAVRFTPLQYPSKIHRIKIYCAGSDAGVAIAQIWDDDESDNLPGSVLSPQVGFSLVPGWNVKDVSQLDIIINTGDVYIGIIETSQTPPIGIDTDPPIDGRSYVNVAGAPPGGTDGLWTSLSDIFAGDFMIRTELDSASNVGIEDPFDVSIPQAFRLGQNYPNPFNPVTTLEFDLPENAATRLSLFDLTGREIMTVIDRELSAGHYQFQLDGHDLVSGIYIYQIYVNGQQKSYMATRKLILLK